MDEENKVENIKEEYYTSTKKKVIDFALGFFAEILFAAICVGINLALVNWLFNVKGIAIIVTIVLILVSNLCLIAYAIREKTRRYLGIGALAAYAIPLLLYGGCFITFSTYMLR